MHGAIAETGRSEPVGLGSRAITAGINSAVAGSTQWLTAHEQRSTDTDVTAIRAKHRPLGDRARVMQDGRRAVCFALSKTRAMHSLTAGTSFCYIAAAMARRI